MSIVPFLLSDALDEFARPLSLFDQNFGLGVLNDDLLNPRVATVPLLSGYIRPWRHIAQRNSGVSNLHHTADGFKVNLDVQQFKPEEVTVKVVDDYVVVEGKHEERKDEHGFISREFKRRYKIPSDINLDAIKSTLSSDGVLQIEAPKKQEAIKAPNERVVQVTQTNQPAVKSAEANKQEKMEQ